MRLVYRIKQLMIIGGDMLGFVLGFWLSLFLRYQQIPTWQKIEAHITLFFLLFLLWIIINFINGLYDLNKLRAQNLPKQFITTGAISFIIGIFFFYISNQQVTPKTILFLTVVLGYLLSYGWRLIYDKFIGHKSLHDNIVFIGYAPETQELIDIIQNHPEGEYKIKALIDPEKKIKPADLPFFDVYHTLTTIRPSITNHKANAVVIAHHLQKDENVLRELYSLLFWDVKIYDLPAFYEMITGRITPSIFSEAWFLENLKTSRFPFYEIFRSVLDMIAAIILGLMFIVLFPVIALAIKLDSKGPVLYKQTRVGKGGKVFFLYKFRSMVALTPDGSAETKGIQFAIKNDLRYTKVGKILRKLRLDELPQFVNLFRRDVTMIGPRPERPEIVDQIQEKMPFFSLRHVVRPGLTGWAVIHQNYTNTLEQYLQKLQYDLFYIKNRSFLLDLSILLRTINIVIRMMGQ